MLSVAVVAEPRHAVFSVTAAKFSSRPQSRRRTRVGVTAILYPLSRSPCCTNIVAVVAAAAPVHQATHYYREGRYTSCSTCWDDFKTSMAAKMCKDEAEAQVG